MGCFSVQKAKKRPGAEQVLKSDGDEGGESMSSSGSEALSAPPSFKGRVRAIQNAQRFINGNRENAEDVSLKSSSPPAPPVFTSPASPLAGRARSATEVGSSIFDVAAAYSGKAAMSNSKPMPLPSPKRSGYPLPHLTDHAEPINNVVSLKVYPSDLHPSLWQFSYDELAAACCDFSCIEDDGAESLFSGRVKLLIRRMEAIKDVLVLRLWEKRKQDFKECVSDLARHQGPYLCKLLGYHVEEDGSELIMVYETLQRGDLHNLLFKASTSALDWHSRIKIAVGAAQGLASLDWKFPDQVMYRDFRTSYIQVDSDYSSKILGCWFLGTAINHDNGFSNPRKNAYCAPETVSRGDVSPKSMVWSYGVVLLELLSGRKNMDERAIKEGKDTLVNWARPFLMDEGKLFLIMDPKLQGRFPSKGSKVIADLILQCLQIDQARRPDMNRVLDVLKSVHEMRYTNRHGSKETGTSYSTDNAYTMSAKTSTVWDHEKPQNLQLKFELTERPQLRPLVIPAHLCSTSHSMQEAGHFRPEYYSSAPLQRLQGF